MVDAIGIAIQALRNQLGIEASSEMPATRPSGPYVAVWLETQSERDFVVDASVSLLCWGSSDVEAQALALGCMEALQAESATHDLLSQASMSALSRDEWAADGSSRYRLSAELLINDL
jgi:hypothetical protein